MLSVLLILDVSAPILSAVGVLLVTLEVSKAQKFEELDRSMNRLSDQADLYKLDRRAFWIQESIGLGVSRKQAEEYQDALDPEMSAASMPIMEGQQLRDTIDDWRVRVAPAAMRWRRRRLWAGFTCLMFAAAIQLARTVLQAQNL
jgi:hypothetical protein